MFQGFHHYGQHDMTFFQMSEWPKTGASQTQENIIIDETLVNTIKQSTLQRWRGKKKEDPNLSQKDNTSVGMVYRLHSDINSGINMSMKILDQSGMVCSSYCGWDHIAMVCENWILQLILDLTDNNILGTLIYTHTQLFISIDVMVWISTYLTCKVWVVNCKLCCSSTWWEVVTL
jgi:hypothetical protein